MTNLIKTMVTHRAETMKEVQALHEKAIQTAAKGYFDVMGFSWAEKAIKEKGEVVDTYFLVNLTFVFDDAKDPIHNWEDVAFLKHGANADTSSD